jgi:transcriptional regulator GlxA family with amidase domain
MITVKPALTALTLLVGLVLVPATARSQATPLPPPTGDSLLQEIRLLRQAVEKQASGSARVQILVGRLAVQNQRVTRAQEAAERLDEKAFTLEQKRRRTDAEVRDLTRSFEQATDARRAELEDKLRLAKARTLEQAATAAQLETRRSRARQSAAQEQARYQDLDARLTELERELLGPAR